MLQDKCFYDWCVASSANFCKGVATKESLKTTGLVVFNSQIAILALLLYCHQIFEEDFGGTEL